MLKMGTEDSAAELAGVRYDKARRKAARLSIDVLDLMERNCSYLVPRPFQ